ncbi:serine/threonine-protein phosphatase 4 regulatory subunit 3-like [Anguilla rostrata]|uniref:serine/threonine-protein phosphatase 4 regulatory subunit 3-like n=1 Tax=Anguilla rostrata TaxID=7938 RepID=UPI0030D11AFC
MGILPALEVILGMDDVQVRSAATDIFSYLVEYNPSMVREFVMQESQQNDDDILLINLIIEHMTATPTRSWAGRAADGPAADAGGPGEHACHRHLKDSEEKEVLAKPTLTGRQSPSFKLSFSSAPKPSLTGPPPTSHLPGSPGSLSIGARTSPPTTAITTKSGLVGLVDYPDDDEEDEDDMENQEEILPLSKKAKLSS